MPRTCAKESTYFPFYVILETFDVPPRLDNWNHFHGNCKFQTNKRNGLQRDEINTHWISEVRTATWDLLTPCLETTHEENINN